MENSTPTALHRDLAADIAALKRPDTAFVVGINGMDGSGKSTFAGQLAAAFNERGHATHTLSIDDFMHPRKQRYARGDLSAEGYYHDSFDFSGFSDALTATRATNPDTTIIAEGVFLFRPEIRPMIDYAIWLAADVNVILSRVQQRDQERFGDAAAITARYRQKYLPAQQLYIDEINPAHSADLVIDNNAPGTSLTAPSP